MGGQASTLRLYEIAATYLHALEALAEMEDLPQEAIADTLEGLSGTFEDKAVNVGAYIRTLEAEASSIEDARKNMERRQQGLKRHAGRLRDYLKQQMERTGLTKVKNHYLLLRVQANPPGVAIEDERQIPERYKHTEITVKLSRNEIARALKAGEDVPGARLEQTTRLVIQ
ncbi:MAG: siphovirus Gp157 family protein [Gammaproteobacteria bacterium]